LDSRKRKGSDLRAGSPRQAISGAIAEADPAQASRCWCAFPELGRWRDGSLLRQQPAPVIGCSCKRGRAGAIASAAKLNQTAWRRQVSRLLATNGYGSFDGLIPALNSALGRAAGCGWLERHCP